MPGTKGSGRKPNIANNLKNKNLDRRDRAEQATELNDRFKAIAKAPPKELSREGKALWKLIVKQLESTRLLTILDTNLLTEYVTQVELSRMATDDIREHGIIVYVNDAPRKNPAVDVKNNAAKIMKSIGSSLGLDPVSRAAILAEKPPEDDDSTDEAMDKFGGGM